MGKLSAFENISLDGYFVDSHGDMGWAHNPVPDPAWNAFVAGNASGDGLLLFGRVTYAMMAGYWPTEQALRSNPVVAERMNGGAKVVFSRTLAQAEWNNTQLIRGDMIEAVRALKNGGRPMTILGSGQIVAQLAQAGLIDEFQLVVNPIAIGAGRTPFSGIDRALPLKLKSSRAFSNGNVVLSYAPAATPAQ